MSNKKILNFIPNFSFGGVETTNINLTEKLIDFGYEVELLTNDHQKIDEFGSLNYIKSLEKSIMLFCLDILLLLITLIEFTTT